MVNLKTKLNYVPTNCGCYLMKDNNGIVIYVGKAKNLKNRLKSYFTGSHNIKTTRLVSQIADFEFVVTNSEQESLILELNLIKQHNPQYNISLTDDKTYPFIELVKNKDTYQIKVVRKKFLRGKLYGPYPNSYAARQTADMLSKMFPMGTYDPIPNFFKVIGDNLIGDDPNHEKALQIVKRFLKGDTKVVVNHIYEHMIMASNNLEYEKALNYKNYLEHIKTTTEKQLISLNDFKNRDILGFDYNNEDISINILFMRQGRIVDQHQQVFNYINDPFDSILQYIYQYYEGQYPHEMLFDNQIEESVLRENFGKIVNIPKIGDKKKLVDLAFKNAKHDLEHYNLVYRSKQEVYYEGNIELQNLLKIQPINTIEVFDNAHLFGANPISAQIVYEHGKLNKKKYRKYHLKTAVSDDYQSFREVIYRKYQRNLSDNIQMPDLILVDGGIGQVNAALGVIKDLNLNIYVAGLKKDNKHKLASLVFENNQYKLNKNDPIYKFLSMLSEEVHRFANQFFKKTRQKEVTKSFLDNIKGIGPVNKKLLLNAFKSEKAIRLASSEELASIGINKKIIKAIKDAI